ncbi:hypothetical protein LTR50_004413 [Elasticomyces elasticus]|nr:hypothetical protein LTR50_004413 [Elasticomyces elasticus]
MADPLYELLAPYFDPSSAAPSPTDPTTSSYLSRLSTLPLSALTSSEPASLAQSSSSLLRSLQTLSKRSHKSVIGACDHLSSLTTTLPQLATEAGRLHDGLPRLEEEAACFAQKYDRNAENPTLEKRRKALLLARNVDRVNDVLELPSLLSSAISSSASTATAHNAASTSISASTSAASTVNYASALDLQAHIKRLHTLYPKSSLISSVSAQAEGEMQAMTTALITSLQSQNLKLAVAMRTIGWLRRVAPDLASLYPESRSTTLSLAPAMTSEGALGSLFLVCRLTNLHSMLEALDPLRELAEQETARRKQDQVKTPNGISGQQTERYLKRYIEIFREQSFGIISMYKSIFPTSLPAPTSSPSTPTTPATANGIQDPFLPLPSALATFPLHLVSLLSTTLKTYLPNISDRGSRDSLLTQVLYCAGSLGRLGGDLGIVLALLEDELAGAASGDGEGAEPCGESDDAVREEEWVEVMKKHRVQAGRLELLASGVRARKASVEVRSPPLVGAG